MENYKHGKHLSLRSLPRSFLQHFMLVILTAIVLSGCGGGGGSSESSVVNVEAQQTIQTQDSAANFYATAAHNNSESALTDTTAYLKTLPDVEDANVAEDGSTIWIKYKNGVVGNIITQSFASLSNTNTNTAATLSSSSALRSAVSVHGEKKALMLLPIESTPGYSDEAAPSIKNSLELAGYVVDAYYNDKANVDIFKTIKDYDVVYIATHGGVSLHGNIAIQTGQIVDAGLLGLSELWDRLKDGDAGGHVIITSNGITTVGLNKNFFKNYTYKNSLIVVNACSSLKNHSLSDAFLGMGASAYLGWDNISFREFGNWHFPAFFEELTKANTTLQSAIGSTIQQHYPASIYKDDNKNKNWRVVLKDGQDVGDTEDTTLNYMLNFSYAGNGNYMLVPSNADTSLPSIPFTGNNSALLSGAAIGTGTAAVGDLRKQIAVTVLGQNDSFAIGTAFATRPSTSSDAAYIVLPVTNTGSQTLCFVKLTGLTYRDAGGAALTAPDFTFVDGSVEKVSSTIFTDTCLVPGETGMVHDITTNLYSAVAKMEFTFESGSPPIGVPTASVIPQSYTTPSTSSAPVITVKNVGSGPANIGGGTSTWFLLDDANQPLSWGFAFTDPSIPSVLVPVSGTATIPGYGFYDGSGSKLLVFVDFEDAPLAASLRSTSGTTGFPLEDCVTSLPADELTMCLHESRNRRLATQATSVQ